MNGYDVLVKVGADISNLTNNMTAAQKTVQNAAKGMETAGGAMLKVFGSLAAVGGAALFGASKAAADFESAWAGVTKTVDGSASEMSALQKEIMAVTSAMPQSTKEIFGVAEAAGQLGIARKDVAAFTKTMLDLGVSTDLSSEEAATSIARFTNIMGTSTSEVDNLGASLVELGNNYAATEGEIMAMAMHLAGTGSVVGLSEQQILGFSTAMANVGINAEAGGTAFSQVMSKMNTATMAGGAKLEGFAKVSGMSAEQFKKAWGENASDAMIQFLKGLDNAKRSGKDVSTMMKDLGIAGIREKDMLLRLSSSWETVNGAVKTAEKGWKENIALLDEANKRYATFDSQLGITKKVVSQFGAALGGPLNAVLGKMLQSMNAVLLKLTSWINAFNEAHPVLAKVGAAVSVTVVALLALAAAFGGVLIFVGMMVSNLGVLATAFPGAAAAVKLLLSPTALLAAAFGKLKPAIMFLLSPLGKLASLLPILVSPIGLVVAGVAALAAGFIYAYKHVEPFRNAIDKLTSGSFSGFIEGVQAMASTALPAISTLLTTLISTITENLPKLITAWLGISQTLLKAVIEMLPVIAQAAVQIIEGLSKAITEVLPTLIPIGLSIIESLIAAITTALPVILEAGLTIITTLVDAIVTALPALIQTGIQIINGLLEAIITALPLLINAGISILTGIIDAVITALPMLINLAVTLITSLLDAIIAALPALIQAGIQIITTLVDAIITFLPQLINAALQIIMALFDALIANLPTIIDAGIKILMALIDGIIKIMPQLVDAAIKIIMALFDALIANLPQIIDAGVKLLMALIDGIIKVLPQIISAALQIIVALASAIISNLPQIIAAGVQILWALIKGILSIIGQILSTAGELVSKFVGGIKAKVGEVLSAGVSMAKAVVDGIKTRVGDMISAAGDFVSGFVNGIKDGIGRAASAAAEMAQSAVASAKKFLHIKSPSRVMRDQVGKHVGTGMALGITNSISNVEKSSTAMAGSVIDTVQSELDIHSPSRVMVQLGRYVGQGFAKGITGTADKVKAATQMLNNKIEDAIWSGKDAKSASTKAAKKLVATLSDQQAKLTSIADKRKLAVNKLSDLNKKLSKATKKTDTSTIKRQIAATKTQIKGYDAQTKAQKAKVAATKSSIKATVGNKEAKSLIGLTNVKAYVAKQNQQLNAIAKTRDKVVAKIKDANKAYKDLVKESKDYAKSIADNIASFGNISSVDSTRKTTAGDIKKELADKLTAIRQFSANIAKLRKLGVNDDTIASIVESGVDGGYYTAKALANASKAEINAINANQKAVNAAANALGKSTSNSMYSAGLDAARGLVKGLEAQKKALDKTATQIGNNIAKAVKKSLGIKSPSRVMRDQVGKFIPLGITAGIEKTASSVNNAMDKLVETPNKRVVMTMGVDVIQPNVAAVSASGQMTFKQNNEDQLDKLADKIVDSISGMSVVMNKKRVGDVITETVSDNQARSRRQKLGGVGLN